MSKTYYEGGGWKVTDSLVHTPKKTFSLERIEAVSLKRTFFLISFTPAIGGIILTFLLWRYLFTSEIITTISASVFALYTSFQFGTLKVDAISLKDDEDGTVYGFFNRLLEVRDAIEKAMQDRDTSNRRSTL